MRRFTSIGASLCLLACINTSHAQVALPTTLPLQINAPFLQFPPLILPANKLVSAYKPNYFLPLHYIGQHKTSTEPQYFTTQQSAHELKNIETAFQLGAKVLLATFGNSAFYAAYTQQSYWQLYSSSAFFRATDYKPQCFVQIPLPFQSPSNDASLRLGYVHQSNGRGSAQERSWNRIYGSLEWKHDPITLLIKLWHIQNDYQLNHYNANIGEYLGYGKIGFRYYVRPDHYITVQKRLSSLDVWHTVEFEYIFPIIPLAQGIIKGFAGYGENLMLYDHYITSFSMGIVLRFM